MNLRQPPLALFLLLAVLLALAIFSTTDENQARQATPTLWPSPIVQTATPTPTAAPGWWDALPTPIPVLTPTVTR